MTAPSASPGAHTPPWTCPFCPLLCDGFSVQAEPAGQGLVLQGSDCQRAQAALARFAALPWATTAQVNGLPASLDDAIAAAASVLAASHQPLFGGLGTDVAGARALYRLACETGAISDAASGRAMMHGLRALQDRGAFTTTLAEVRARADVIVCLTGSPTLRHPEFYRRCGVGELRTGETRTGEMRTGETRTGGDGAAATPLARHVVVLGDAAQAADAAAALHHLPGISTEHLPWHGDLFSTASMLAALVAGRAVRNAPAALVALAARLLAARYAVIVWEAGALPAHGALVVEAINATVGALNRSTRAAALPLGGGDGAATVNQVFAWLSGLPLRSRLGPAGLEHEPHRFDAASLLADNAVDALLWVASFGTEPAPPLAKLPRIVLGSPHVHGLLAPTVPNAESGAAPNARSNVDSVFIPVSTPGIGSAGHLFRTEGVVLLPVHAVRPDTLPTVASVVSRLTAEVQALRHATQRAQESRR